MTEKIPENIYRLLVKQLTDPLSDEEQQQLSDWQSMNPGGASEELLNIWEAAAPQEPANIPPADVLWQNISERISSGQSDSLSKKSWLYRLAAAAVLLALLSGIYFYFSAHFGHQHISTAVGERQKIILPDSSVVMMNYASRIEFPEQFDEAAREVVLHGEAFFDIAHSPKPFRIRTSQSIITVLGTAFNVWQRGSKTRVQVVRGSVAFASSAEPEATVILNKGQESYCQSDNLPASPTIANDTLEISWLVNKLAFDHTPLLEVIEELQNKYDVTIRLRDPELGGLTVSGSFGDLPVEKTVHAICRTLGLRYEFQNNQYLIISAEAKSNIQ